VARRQVDDEPPDLAVAQCHELRGDDFDVPAHRKAGPRVQVAETALRKADEIAPQQPAVLGDGQPFLGWGFHHGHFILSPAGRGERVG